jgi:hypothetical protein
MLKTCKKTRNLNDHQLKQLLKIPFYGCYRYRTVPLANYHMRLQCLKSQTFMYDFSLPPVSVKTGILFQIILQTPCIQIAELFT